MNWVELFNEFKIILVVYGFYIVTKICDIGTTIEGFVNCVKVFFKFQFFSKAFDCYELYLTFVSVISILNYR